MPQIFVSHSATRRFNQLPELTQCGALLNTAQVFFQLWASENGQTHLDITRKTIQNCLQSDSWPKYEDQELMTQIQRTFFGQAKANFTYWNPMDGSSWELIMTLWTGKGKQIQIACTSNMSEAGFQVTYAEEDAQLIPSLTNLLQGF